MKKFLFYAVFIVLAFSGKNVFAQTAELTVTKPTDGESLSLGESYTIEWESPEFALPTTVAIALSPVTPSCLSDNPPCEIAQTSPYIITESAPNTGQYSWTVPSSLSTSYIGENVIYILVNGTDYVGLSDEFIIEGKPDGTTGNQINIITPIANQVLVKGTQYVIAWTGHTAPVVITLEPYIVCVTAPCVGSPIYTILNQTTTLGYYTWNVGTDSSNASIPTGQYYLHISNNTSDVAPDKVLIQISDTQLSCLGREGQNIKYSNSSAVYYIKNCKKEIYSSAKIYFAWNQTFGSVVTVPSTEIYESNGMVKLPSGLLIKGTTSSTVYLTEGSMVKPFGSAAGFLARGYSFSQVKIFDDADIAVHALGETIP